MPEYIVVEKCSLQALVTAVNDKIKEGYEPIGGISVLRYEWREPEWEYAQAMIKHENS